ncbi:MAG: hypothetical protein RIE73_12245 [Coleofasciculus sp. C1-SOL-03]|jgi:hypothetical protein|uniref:hypothetical protein n=1 Tax=Coleofasciculus sp. C1-SOL-03 TaxID=3069522 RepID=UPI0032FBE463
MSYRPYFSALDELKAELENNPLLEVYKSQLQYGPGSEVVKILLSDWEIEAPEEVINFYGEVGKASFEWQLKENAFIDHQKAENLLITGHIELLSLDQSLLGFNPSKGWKDVVWFEDMNEEDLAFYQSIRPFDFFFPDSGKMACFRVANGKITEKLFLFGDEIGLQEMDIGVKEYVELLVQTRGMLSWQEAWLFKGGKNQKQIKHYLPRLFNEVNLEGF